MRRAVKWCANIIVTLTLTYALLQLLALSVVGNALDVFYGTAIWDWLINRFHIYAPEDQEGLIDYSLLFLSLIVSILIVYGGNRLISQRQNRKQGG
jgi:hypothetical protein